MAWAVIVLPMAWQEHFVQHRLSPMAEAIKDIRLGEQQSESSSFGDSASFYS